MIRIQWLGHILKRMTDRKVLSTPDLIIGGAEDPYMRRWFIIPRNRWFNIYLHEIVRSDDDRALHDHPWWSLSLVLDGQMLEVLPISKTDIGHGFGFFIKRYLKKGHLVLRGAKAAHRLELREKSTCRTLFITGPRIREWGFYCASGWRHWKDFTSFHETGDGTRIGRGCGEL